MNKILISTKYVVENARDVKINRGNLESFCDKVTGKDFEGTDFGSLIQVPNLRYSDKVNLAFVYNSINFCFWQEPRWTVTYNGKSYAGSLALAASFYKALAKGTPILNPEYLKRISESELLEIFNGENRIPLFEERLGILRDLGSRADKGSDNFDGEGLFDRASYDTLKLVDLITETFPSFRDNYSIDEREIYFNKRAQCAVFDLNDCIKLKNFEQLTSFADYKLPHVLRMTGILEYSEGLSDKVDKKHLITPGSREEIEIRASQIWAIEYMRDALVKRFKDITSVQIDNWLWAKGKERRFKEKPAHRTVTTAY